MIYDMTSPKIQAAEQGNMVILEPIVNYELCTNTYERILGQWINHNDLYKSWFVLQSCQYSQI